MPRWTSKRTQAQLQQSPRQRGKLGFCQLPAKKPKRLKVWDGDPDVGSDLGSTTYESFWTLGKLFSLL